MGVLLLEPVPFVGVKGSGVGLGNLLTPRPKEVWSFTGGGQCYVDLDFGVVRTIDTIVFGYIRNPPVGTPWSIGGGLGNYFEFTIGTATVALDPSASQVGHALWHGNPVATRYLSLGLGQPSAQPFPSIGLVLAGAALVPTFAQEMGAGRGVKDTGSVTRLPSGDLSTVEGARVGTYGWTWGDLTQAEADRLYAMQKRVGETRPILLVEDPAPSGGLVHRIHYGMLTGLKRYERRNAAQVRWDFAMEEWT